jgi:hypothetical protein
MALGFRVLNLYQQESLFINKTFTKKKSILQRNCQTQVFLEQATHNYFKGREYIKHSSYLFFVLPYNKALNASKFTNPFRKMENGIHKKLDHNIQEFIKAVFASLIHYKYTSFLYQNIDCMLALCRKSNSLSFHTRINFAIHQDQNRY